MRALNWAHNFNSVWMEPRASTQERAIFYATKEDTRAQEGLFEPGFPVTVRQGVPNPPNAAEIWGRVHEIARNGGGVDGLLQEGGEEGGDARGLKLYARNHAGIDKILRHEEMKRNPPPAIRDVEVILYWGASGTGKTAAIMDEHPDIYRVYRDSLSFEDYSGDVKTILFDEFVGGIRYDIFFGLLDVYRLRVNVKYGHAYAAWNKVYITSNKHYSEWYPNLNEQQKIALSRRISKVVHFTIEDNVVIETEEKRELPTQNLTFSRKRKNIGVKKTPEKKPEAEPKDNKEVEAEEDVQNMREAMKLLAKIKSNSILSDATEDLLRGRLRNV